MQSRGGRSFLGYVCWTIVLLATALALYLWFPIPSRGTEKDTGYAKRTALILSNEQRGLKKLSQRLFVLEQCLSRLTLCK
jgi:hypothetical protein